MLTVEKIKRLLAVLILACLFLPLSQCSIKHKPENPSSSQSVAPTQDVYIPITVVLSDPLAGLTVVALFAWPLGAIAIRRRVRRDWQGALLSVIEMAACAASTTYVVSVVRLWGEIRYGGLIMLICLAVYFMCCGSEVVRYVRKRFGHSLS